MEKYLYSSIKLQNGMNYVMHSVSDFSLTVIHELSFNDKYVLVSFYLKSNITKSGFSKINGDSKTSQKYKLYKNTKGYYFNYLGYKHYLNSFGSNCNEIAELTKSM